jgi:hypothetical protein
MPSNDSAPLPNSASLPAQTFVLVLPNGIRLILSVPTTAVNGPPSDSPAPEFEFTSVKIVGRKKVSRRKRSDSATSARNGLSRSDSDHLSVSRRVEVPGKYRKVVREWFAQVLRDLSDSDQSTSA